MFDFDDDAGVDLEDIKAYLTETELGWEWFTCSVFEQESEIDKFFDLLEYANKSSGREKDLALIGARFLDMLDGLVEEVAKNEWESIEQRVEEWCKTGKQKYWSYS